MSILSPEFVANADKIRHAFDTAQPFRHALITPFFRPDVCRRMLDEFPHADPATLVNEFGMPNKKKAVHDVRNLGPTYREIDDFICTPEFAELMSRVTGIPDLLYDPEYHGAGTHDNLSGQAMDAHVDFNLHRTTGYHRRINAIIYLNEHWEEDWGGNITLHSNPWDPDNDETESFLPLMNHCLLFETNEISWHGFDPVATPEGSGISRKSFTIYMYTKERPVADTAPKHGTIYVQPPLPKHLVAGHTLSEGDVESLKVNFLKRNNYLKGMYKREADFQAAIQGLQAFRAHQQIPSVGWGRVHPGVEGLHANFGAMHRTTMTISAARPVSSLTLAGQVPDYLGSNDLTVLLDGEERASLTATGNFELRIDGRLEAGREYRLEVLASDVRSPKDAGVAPDAREYSVFLRELRFED